MSKSIDQQVSDFVGRWPDDNDANTVVNDDPEIISFLDALVGSSDGTGKTAAGRPGCRPCVLARKSTSRPRDPELNAIDIGSNFVCAYSLDDYRFRDRQSGVPVVMRRCQHVTGLCAFGILCVILGIAVGYFLLPQPEASLASSSGVQPRELDAMFGFEDESPESLFDFPISRELGIEVLEETPVKDGSLLLHGNLIAWSTAERN